MYVNCISVMDKDMRDPKKCIKEVRGGFQCSQNKKLVEYCMRHAQQIWTENCHLLVPGFKPEEGHEKRFEKMKKILTEMAKTFDPNGAKIQKLLLEQQHSDSMQFVHKLSYDLRDWRGLDKNHLNSIQKFLKETTASPVKGFKLQQFGVTKENLNRMTEILNELDLLADEFQKITDEIHIPKKLQEWRESTKASCEM